MTKNSTEYMTQYYKNNKAGWNAKYGVKTGCECGSIVSKYNLLKHKSSKKHLILMEKIKKEHDVKLIEEPVEKVI